MVFYPGEVSKAKGAFWPSPGELRAIRKQTAQLLHDNNGQLPAGFIPALETILPKYAEWKPSANGEPRAVWSQCGEGLVDPFINPYQRALLQRLNAILRGMQAYVTDHATERTIKSDRHGPIGLKCLSDEQRQESLPFIGKPTALTTSQGAVLGYMLGMTLSDEAVEMCRDPVTSPLTKEALAQFIFLDRLFDGTLTHRLDELLAMDYQDLLPIAEPQLAKIGRGGSTVMGYFVEAVRSKCGELLPSELQRITENSMDALRPMMNLRPAPILSQLVRALASDYGQVIYPPHGTPWHPRYFEMFNVGRHQKLKLSSKFDELVNPSTSMTFRDEIRAILENNFLPVSVLDCVALIRTTDSESGQQRIPSALLTLCFLARAATQTSVFNSNSPRPVDIRPGASRFTTGDAAWIEITSRAAATLPTGRVSLDVGPG